MPVEVDSDRWERRLKLLAEEYRVPGATLGILRHRQDWADEVTVMATGVLNKQTGVPTTADSLFQIGSITKVWTATVVMQLVERGLLELDTPVVEVLPNLRLGDSGVTSQVTLHHLLTHTSGIEGDLFLDTGRGDDCLEQFVVRLREFPQNHPPGATWSYCNSGYTLTGRVIEHVVGTTWDKAMRNRLFEPLGLIHTVTLPEEALLFRTAVGHVGEEVGDPYRAPTWVLPRSTGPAGLITASAANVLAFARIHLSGGLAADGSRLLREETIATMANHHAERPDNHPVSDSWGLGWARYLWDGWRILGHDGGTIGQSAFLRVCPEAGLAVVLLTNGGHSGNLYEDLFREIFGDLAGIALPPPLQPPSDRISVDCRPHAGTYERVGSRLEVYSDGGMRLRETVTGPLAHYVPDPTKEYGLVPVSDNLFALRPPGARMWTPVTFFSLPSGRRYVHFRGRATPKVDH
jgi:CubicO group peptidase (beta-lactamase class C family)